MIRRWLNHLLLAALSVALLVACNMQSSSERTARPSETVRADLAARLDDTRAAQEAALDLWDRIIFGQPVSCQEAILVPEPVALPDPDRAAYPAADAIQAVLNEAIGHVRDSADLWNGECGDPRGTVPLERARDGRAAALLAGDPLAAAADRLAAWPDGSVQ